ncbi:MAG TPA: hypothetical protein VEY12_05075 [Thermoplasmata archaeon]|nr:hypothetical protein [Thermoplasmata archaeon]
MLHVAVVGDRGSGKTTVLGLLYLALVRSGSGRNDDLRFRVTLDSLEEVTGLFQQLMSGSFPDAAAKEGLHGLDFEVGFRRSRLGGLSRRDPGEWTADTNATIRVALPGSLDAKTPGLFSGSTIGTGPWRDALDADALLILADATQLVPKGETDESAPLRLFDRQVEALLTSIQRWRSRGGRETLHPIFVVTKFDAVPRKILQAANVDPQPPEAAKTGPRAVYAKALLNPSLPRTLATLNEGGGTKLRFARPSFFFSSVGTDTKTADASERIRLRRIDGGGWEPEYSWEEYHALLDTLGDIAAGTKA